MRWTILAMATLAAGCGPQPQNRAAMENAASAIEDDRIAVTNISEPLPPRPRLSLEECLDHGDSYCAIGRRGTPAHRCFGIRAFLAGSGTREVRAAPDAGSRLLGRIHGETDNDLHRAASFEVIDSSNGWLQIDHAADDPDINGGIDRKMYTGKGWIRGEKVQVSAQARRAFAAPDFASPVVIHLDAGGFDGAEQMATLACDGSWVQARWRFRKNDPDRAYPTSWRPEAIMTRDPLVLQGWVTGICGSQETTCDGLSGDAPRD